MKRASYRDGVRFIAFNDEDACMVEEEMLGVASVVMLASLFDVTTERVARDVINIRRRVAHGDATGEDW